jgi:hypothetical protein
VFALVNERTNDGAVPVAIGGSGQIQQGGPINLPTGHPTMIAFAGGTPWVADRDGDVMQLDPASLSVVRTVSATGPVVRLDASSGRLWVFTRDAAIGLDPWTGARLVAIPTPFDIIAGAAAPNGASVYVAVSHVDHTGHVDLFEMDPRTGAIVARTTDGDSELGGVSGLTATPSGVWIAYPTGMMGSGDFARRSDLHHQRGGPEATGWIGGTNAIRLFRVGRRIWQSSGGLECFDPKTGKELGLAVPEQKQVYGLGQVGVETMGRLDVVAAKGRWLWRIRPPTTCPTR